MAAVDEFEFTITGQGGHAADRRGVLRDLLAEQTGAGPGDVVLDPFCGSGMTGVAALANKDLAHRAFLSGTLWRAVVIWVCFGHLPKTSIHRLERAVKL